MQNRYDGSTPLSFLFLGYREKRWYYEFIIMGKKAGLILLSVFLIATLASYFADFIRKHKWLGYLGLFVILIIAIQLIIGGLVNYEVLSINEKFKFLFAI